VASFPQLKGYDINIKETLRKDVLSYLMASASCFPAFPVTVINGGQYIDGAYHDRLPIDLCFKLGADHVIAVDLNNQAVSHPEYVNDANVTYIHSYNSLGAFMMIKKDVIERNITLGYHDTLKAFRKYIGFLYTFYPDSQHDDEGKKLALKLEDKKLHKVKSLLIDGVRGPITDRGIFIRMLEILADKLNIETTKIYKIEELISLIDDEIKVGSRADEIMLLKPAQRHFQLSSMKLNTQFGLIKQMKNDNLIFDEAMSDLFDEEYPILSVCALFYGLV
jgi:NTE family protein